MDQASQDSSVRQLACRDPLGSSRNEHTRSRPAPKWLKAWHAGKRACLLAALSMLAILPAHAASSGAPALSGAQLALSDELEPIPHLDQFPAPQPPSDLVQQNYQEVLHAIDAYPDVVVFPIHVAGPVIAAETGHLPHRLANKLAQASVTTSIAVIYPDIGEPYRSVFAQIISGIEDKAKGPVANFAVGTNVNIDELNNSLRSKDTKVVIALGRQGVKVASALDGNFGVIAGGVLTAPENEIRNIQVNTLSPDPALLFSRLKGLMPGVHRIFTVYDPRQSDWLIQLARQTASEQGLELVAYEAHDLRSAVHAYQDILGEVDSSRDALWLPQDPTTVEDSTVLPMLLKESWDRSLAVFSSSFGHVRRGVLFSLYPNNVELGRYLASSAMNAVTSGSGDAGSMLPLREVLMAVNLRTARHLGINPARAQNVDMSFPEQ